MILLIKCKKWLDLLNQEKKIKKDRIQDQLYQSQQIKLLIRKRDIRHRLTENIGGSVFVGSANILTEDC